MPNAMLHVLLLTQAEHTAEGIVSLLRSSGTKVIAHVIQSLPDLTNQLHEKTWDLLIANEVAQDIRYDDLMEHCQSLNQDIPVILLVDELTSLHFVNGVREGVAAITSMKNPAALLLCLKNEWRHVRDRRRLYDLERQHLFDDADSESNSACEEKLRLLRQRDLATGLLNLTAFTSRLEKLVVKAGEPDFSSALLFLRVQNYYKVLEDVGVVHSDTILRAVAAKLKECVGKSGLWARLDGGYFVCLLGSCEARQALKLGEKIAVSLEKMLIEVGDKTAKLAANVGVTLISHAENKSSTLIQEAFAASLYTAKGVETVNVHLYEAQQKSYHQASQGADLSRILEEAIRTNGFNLLFQPLMSMQGDPIEHYEAFLRLKMPDGSETSAGVFFNNPTISDELKRKIDRWVIIRTTKHLIAHQAKGHNTRILINLAATSLADDSLPKWIDTAIRVAKVPKGSFVFQFHESDAEVMLKQAKEFTQNLKKIGIYSGISRFGHAENSMQVLGHLAVDYVKVDAIFVQELESKEAQAELQHMLEALHEQKKITIIPSVENALAMASLWQTGAHFLQGYGVQAPNSSMNFNFSDEQEI